MEELEAAKDFFSKHVDEETVALLLKKRRRLISVRTNRKATFTAKAIVSRPDWY